MCSDFFVGKKNNHIKQHFSLDSICLHFTLDFKTLRKIKKTLLNFWTSRRKLEYLDLIDSLKVLLFFFFFKLQSNVQYVSRSHLTIIPTVHSSIFHWNFLPFSSRTNFNSRERQRTKVSVKMRSLVFCSSTLRTFIWK